MYLYSRRAQLAPGHLADAMAWATSITELVTQTSGLPVQLWSATLSPGVGTLAWTTWVPDLPTIETAFDKLAVDPAFLASSDAGAAFLAGGADDSIVAILSGEPDLTRQITYVTAVSSVAREGKVGKAMEVGTKLAALASEITGETTLFGTVATGPWGGVEWLTGFTDIAALEAAQGKLNTDPRWVKLIDDEAGDVFTKDPNLTTQMLFRRVV